MQVIDDERHLVFECSAFDHFRAARRDLFSVEVGEDMRCFMRQRNQKGVFWYVMTCLREIRELADVDRSQMLMWAFRRSQNTYDSD